MFRRPALCVIDSAFKDAARLPATKVCRLSRRPRNELLTLSMLGPVLQSDLRASWCPKIFCMDASPAGAGLASADSTPEAVRELWHNSEQRGYCTKLEAPSSAPLWEFGFESEVVFDTDVPIQGPDLVPVPPGLSEGILFDAIEIYMRASKTLMCPGRRNLYGALL